MTRPRAYSYTHGASSPASSSASASDAAPARRTHRPAAQYPPPQFISTTYVNSFPRTQTHVPLTTSRLAQMSISGPRRYDPSATPSSTSVSDGEEETEIDEYTAQRMRDGSVWEDRDGRGKGKGKERMGMGMRRNTIRTASDIDGSGLAGLLPPEILRHIFKMLPTNKDVKSALLVSRSWCICAFSILWNKPSFSNINTLVGMLRVLSSREQTFPYASTIRRLNLTNIAEQLNDPLFLCLSVCTHVERLTMAGASQVSAGALYRVLQGMTELVAVDFTDVANCQDEVVEFMAQQNPRLQGLNLSGCRKITDAGLLAVAKHCPMLKRVKLIKSGLITERSLIPLAENCPLLLEVDLAFVGKTSDSASRALWTNSYHLREMRFINCTALTEAAIPNLADLQEHVDLRGEADLPCKSDLIKIYRPVSDVFEHLRTIDLTGCNLLGDDAVDALVCNAPKLRTLTLAKCTALTDQSLYSIGRLGKHLHHLHLGHIRSLTDTAVKRVVQMCSRLRFIDLACCPLITDESVLEIVKRLPKLRRIGLVKVTSLTDESVYALAEKHPTLERIHLSYCENITVKSITYAVNRLRNLTHLSLTGVPAFTHFKELQKFCRPPPSDFTDNQINSFCVFSGQGVRALREYLLHVESLNAAGSEDGGSRRQSEDSSASSDPDHSGSFSIAPLPRNSWQNGASSAAPIRSSAFTNATANQSNYNFFAPNHVPPPSHYGPDPSFIWLDEAAQDGVQAWRQQQSAPHTRRTVYDSPFSTASDSRQHPRRRSEDQEGRQRDGDRENRQGRQGSWRQDGDDTDAYRPPGAYVLDP